jgi:hypothetical protein
VDACESVVEKNYGPTLVHFTFRQDSTKLIEAFYILYEIYAQLGAPHRAIANIEQEAKNLEVVFTQFEPDYLYDTFWRPEVAPDPPSFRMGVQTAWSLWWLPCLTAAIAALTARWRVASIAAALFLVGICTWAFFALDSELVPGRDPWFAGLAAGFVIATLITWPVRSLVRTLKGNAVRSP